MKRWVRWRVAQDFLKERGLAFPGRWHVLALGAACSKESLVGTGGDLGGAAGGLGRRQW